MAKVCSCALSLSEFVRSTKELLDIYNEHVKTGRLSATAAEIKTEILKTEEAVAQAGEACGLDVSGAKALVQQAKEHYDDALRRGDIHGLSEAAEIAAEADLPLFRRFWACAEAEK